MLFLLTTFLNIWLYPMKFKSEVSILFPIFKKLVEKQFNTTIKTFYSDNGGEYIKLKSFFQQHGITHLTTPPHTPEHNGLSERKHRHLTETARFLIHYASLPLTFWSFAFQTAAYLINCLPTQTLHMTTPYNVLFKTSPNYTKLKTFGCLCFPWLKPYTHNKLEQKSEPCVFLGYSLTQSAYICYNFKTNKIHHSRHVQFLENEFSYSYVFNSTTSPTTSPSNINQSFNPLTNHIPLSTSRSNSSPNSTSTLPITPIAPTNQRHITNTPTIISPQNSNSTLSISPTTSTNETHTNNPPTINISPSNETSHNSPTLCTSSQSQSIPAAQPPLVPTHNMVTRGQKGIFKPKKLFSVSKYPIPPSVEPTCVSKALQHVEWKQAMSDEFMALMKNGTWSLVPPEPRFNIIGNKWVFRLKRNPDGSIARYKAQLVAKGFHQRPGIDFKDTFSPIIKPQTIKLVLSIAISKKWLLSQMDVNNAFLQGTLSEEVYMSQPLGFIHQNFPHHVCKLHKSLYGLKQAPRAWYNELKSFVVAYGFSNSKSDPSLFIYNKDNVISYFLVYVDDLLLIGNDSSFLHNFKQALAKKFSLKDLGTPSHFLGVELLPTSTGIFMTQHHYIRELLQKANMLDAKPVSTPMATSCSLTLEDDTSVCDASFYRSIIGSLHYLSITRPDVAFPVNKLSQFMQKPNTTHMQALKRVLRYLKATISHGLHLVPTKCLTLQAFCDADWGGDINDRKSTGAYIIYLGSNAISWSCKKQPTVARSSTEAEYRTIGSTTTELLWLQQVLKELGINIQQPPSIFSDNIGATYLCANPVFHTRMKHLAIDYHFVRDLVAKNQLTVSHVPSSHQLADLLTKPLSSARHSFLTSKIGVVESSSILWGRIGVLRTNPS